MNGRPASGYTMPPSALGESARGGVATAAGSAATVTSPADAAEATASAAADTAGMGPEQLIFACQGLVRSLAWRFAQRLPRNVELDDLIGYGQVGLAQAARDFDPARGVRFTTYAYYRIRGAIMDGLSRMSWFNVIDFYRGTWERQSEQVFEFEQASSTATGDERAGSPAGSAAGNEGEGVGDGAWLKRTVGRLAVVSMMSELSEGAGGGGDGVARGEMAESGPGPSAAAADRELLDRLCALVAELPGDAGVLIRGSYFEGRTLTQMAAQLGVSKSWASRLHARTLERLACALRLLGEE